jgi:N-acetylneuraminic acid mutarotase
MIDKSIYTISLIVLIAFFSNSFVNAQTTMWTWMKGANISDRFGIYGTKGVGSATNTPGARYSSVNWKDKDGNLWLFGGHGFAASGASGPLNDLWKYNVTTNEWTWISGDSSTNNISIYGVLGTPSSSNKPGARRQSTCWTDTSGNFWLFGGYGRTSSSSGTLNDLWKYDSKTNMWTWVYGDNLINQRGIYGMQGYYSSGKPGARWDAVAWTEGNLLCLFGGIGYAEGAANGYLNDLWGYNTQINRWVWLKGDSVLNSKGVYGNLGTAASTNKPGSRFLSTTFTDTSRNLWLFGGYASSGGLNDLWKYNRAQNQWTWMHGDSIKNKAGVYGTIGVSSVLNKPGARYGGYGFSDTSGLWLFGGNGKNANDSLNDMNDLWKYNTVSNEWVWLKGGKNDATPVYGTRGIPDINNNPGGRTMGVSWKDNAGNFWIFGGADYVGYLNDLWKLTQAPCVTNTWTGLVNTSWENGGNWSCGIVPNSSTNVVIGDGHTISISSNATINSITLGNSILTVQSNYVLTILN